MQFLTHDLGEPYDVGGQRAVQHDQQQPTGGLARSTRLKR
jgi:hypothetical protein